MSGCAVSGDVDAVMWRLRAWSAASRLATGSSSSRTVADIEASAALVKSAVTKWQHVSGATSVRVERGVEAAVRSLQRLRQAGRREDGVIGAKLRAVLAQRDDSTLPLTVTDHGSTVVVTAPDMFSLEVALGEGEVVEAVTVKHDGLGADGELPCGVLVGALSGGRWRVVADSIRYLTSLYTLPLPPPPPPLQQRRLLVNASLALERVVTALHHITLSHLKSGDGASHVMKVINHGLLGLPNVHNGCLPVHLTYLLPPRCVPVLEETVNDGSGEVTGVGYEATLRLTEASTSNPIPVGGVTVGEMVTASLPVHYTLMLKPPLVMCNAVVAALRRDVPGVMINSGRASDGDATGPRNLLSAMVGAGSAEAVLPVRVSGDGTCTVHSYRVHVPTSECGMLRDVSCAEPLLLPQVVRYLRQQATLNELIRSCRRGNVISPRETCGEDGVASSEDDTTCREDIRVTGDVTMTVAGDVDVVYACTTGSLSTIAKHSLRTTIRPPHRTPTDRDHGSPVLDCYTFSHQEGRYVSAGNTLNSVINDTFSLPHTIHTQLLSTVGLLQQ